MKITAVRIFVEDLGAARRFYAEKLGLTIQFDGSDHGYCVFKAGPVDLVIEVVAADAPDDDRALVGRFSGLSFAVQDAEATYRQLSSQGVSFTGLPELQTWGGTLATLTDPSGNALQIVQYPAPPDVPSPIDLQDDADARAWAESANTLRPWRLTFFDAISKAIDTTRAVRVLELGSGPGFLAEVILRHNPGATVVLLDFSGPMHRLAQERLQAFSERVSYVERSFKEADWMNGLGDFDCVVTNQAVHELRHKRYAEPLHRQVRSVLRPGGSYLVCDHYFGEDGMKKEGLYMTVEEQQDALRSAGYQTVQELLRQGGMCLHRAV